MLFYSAATNINTCLWSIKSLMPINHKWLINSKFITIIGSLSGFISHNELTSIRIHLELHDRWIKYAFFTWLSQPIKYYLPWHFQGFSRTNLHFHQALSSTIKVFFKKHNFYHMLLHSNGIFDHVQYFFQDISSFCKIPGHLLFSRFSRTCGNRQIFKPL